MAASGGIQLPPLWWVGGCDLYRNFAERKTLLQWEWKISATNAARKFKRNNLREGDATKSQYIYQAFFYLLSTSIVPISLSP
jgi:hypothetical protein